MCRPKVNGWQLVDTTGLREVARTCAMIVCEEMFAQRERKGASVDAGAMDLYTAGWGPVRVEVNSEAVEV